MRFFCLFSCGKEARDVPNGHLYLTERENVETGDLRRRGRSETVESQALHMVSQQTL